MLLVEDDPSIREMAGLGLGNAGFRVTSCADGREGLERLRRDPFDLAVLDVMLPSLDGFEITREVRKDSRIPIVMLTARADATDVIVGLELGADDYVTKPFDMPVLVARCRAVLRRAAAEPADPALRVGDLEIDVGGFAARKGGRELALTATEFRLLVELARRPGQVAHARGPARAGVGLRVPRRLAAGRRRRPAAPRQDRGRSRASRR